MKYFLLVTFLLISPMTAKSDPIKLVFSDSYVPMSWDSSGKMRGIIIDVLNATLKKNMGMVVQYKGYPWARAQSEVRKGISDAFVTVPTKARLEYTTCSTEPVIVTEVSIYAYANHPRKNELLSVKSYDDLDSYVLVDYLGNGWAKGKFKDLNVIWAETLEQTYKLLVAKRADIVVRNSFNFDYFSRHLDIRDKIEKMPAILSSVNFHLCIRKSSEHVAILPAFDAVMKEMRETGRINEITADYGN